MVASCFLAFSRSITPAKIPFWNTYSMKSRLSDFTWMAGIAGAFTVSGFVPRTRLSLNLRLVGQDAVVLLASG
jgi:hypothetical protein